MAGRLCGVGSTPRASAASVIGPTLPSAESPPPSGRRIRPAGSSRRSCRWSCRPSSRATAGAAVRAATAGPDEPRLSTAATGRGGGGGEVVDVVVGGAVVEVVGGTVVGAVVDMGSGVVAATVTFVAAAASIVASKCASCDRPSTCWSTPRRRGRALRRGGWRDGSPGIVARRKARARNERLPAPEKPIPPAATTTAASPADRVLQAAADRWEHGDARRWLGVRGVEPFRMY